MVDKVFAEPEPNIASWEEPYHSNRGLWWAFVLLLVALGIACGIGYHSMRKDNLKLSMVPDAVKSVTALGTRVDDLEAKASAWPSQWSGLVDRVSKLDRMVNAEYLRARKYAQTLNAQTEQNLQARLNSQKSDVDAKLNQMRTELDTQRAQLASLKEKVSSTQTEVAALRNDNQQSFASMREWVSNNAQKTDSLAEAMEAPKVSFEAAKHRSTELTDGVSLHVSRTNVRYQRFGGWISLTDGGRTLWVQRRGVDQPVIFNRKSDDGEYDLVVTRVTRNSVVGYIVLPPQHADNSENSLLKPPRRSVSYQGGE